MVTTWEPDPCDRTRRPARAHMGIQQAGQSFQKLPCCLPALGAPAERREEMVVHVESVAPVCLRLCHWTQSKFNYPETNKQTNKQTEDTCLRERNAPPRKGMPQPAPRAPGSACSTTSGWRSPWGAGSHHESQKWTNESRLTQHTCDPRGRICWL